MQIPKQPRTKSPSDISEAHTDNPSSATDLNKQLAQDYSSYISDVNRSYAQAHLDQAKAYISYLDALQQEALKPGANPTVEYWKELLQAHGDAHAMVGAQAKYATASINHQSTYQKTLADSYAAYSQALRDIIEKLQNEIGQHNQKVADALKDALLKTDVGTASLPTLSLLYQGIRTMNAASTSTPSETALRRD
jgi:hypothetical protein